MQVFSLKFSTSRYSAFNTIVPSMLINNLRTMGLNTPLCNWILAILTGHPQVVRVCNNTSATVILNTGAPQGCVLSPLLYSLFTHDYPSRNAANASMNFDDDAKAVGLITDKDETAYREEVRDLTVWCQDNNLFPQSNRDKGDDCGLQDKKGPSTPPFSSTGL